MSLKVENNISYGLKEKPAPLLWGIFSLQHVLAMFGSNVLVPYLTGMDPSIALIASGIGTILFLLINRGTVPAYLGSSFAFITPAIIGFQGGGWHSVFLSFILVGVVFVIISAVIRIIGTNWINKILPSVVVAPVIMVIGLELAKIAATMAFTSAGKLSEPHVIVSIITLVSIIISSIYLGKIFSLIPILFGIVVGYISAIIAGMVDFTAISNAPWFSVPNFNSWSLADLKNVNWAIVFGIAPVAFVVLSEHIGHQLVLGNIVGINYMEKTRLSRSILGDGVSTMFSGFIGGAPTTTYGENIGVLSITKVFSCWVIGGAGVIAIALGFIGKVSAFIQSIPTAVMGGVSILLFGMIAASGLRMMVEDKIDLGNRKNLIIVAIVLIVGIGGASIDNVPGMGVATATGIFLSIIMQPNKK